MITDDHTLTERITERLTHFADLFRHKHSDVDEELLDEVTRRFRHRLNEHPDDIAWAIAREYRRERERRQAAM